MSSGGVLTDAVVWAAGAGLVDEAGLGVPGVA